MSKKHYFAETAVNTLVPRYLTALTTANPHLAFLPEYRVVTNTNHSPSHVTLISGGGSGHEPAWSGYVGDGLLSAVACGDIFASPSMKQILAAIAVVPSDKGTILLITNYTGDKLHFGLAAERALAGGFSKKITVLSATDDVSIGRSRSTKVGRRGLAGNVITMKILGAAAAQNYSFEGCVKVGNAVNDQLVSIGSSLDHCHVPGRQSHDEIGDDVCVIGAGIHNEPGAQKISPFPSVEDLIAQLLTLLCDPNDPERAFVKFGHDDEVVLLLDNYGGLSPLELGALTHEVLSQLETVWHIRPVKIYSATFETSLNGPGFSISLCNMTLAAKNSETEVRELLDLLEAETKAPSWPNVLSNTSTRETKNPAPRVDIDNNIEVPAEADIEVDPKLLNTAVRLACQRAIAEEPNLTKWDMIMGDGDCGEGVKAVSLAILDILDTGHAQSGSIPTLLHHVINAVDTMGGSLGAILGILLAALSSHLRTAIISSKSRLKTSAASYSLVDILAPSFLQAVESLKRHTDARVGDRTVMDVLIPFAEALDATREFGKAVDKAVECAEGTRKLKPSFGRATYVAISDGDEQNVPDPGAWAVMEFLRGMYDAKHD